MSEMSPEAEKLLAELERRADGVFVTMAVRELHSALAYAVGYPGASGPLYELIRLGKLTEIETHRLDTVQFQLADTPL